MKVQFSRISLRPAYPPPQLALTQYYMSENEMGGGRPVTHTVDDDDDEDSDEDYMPPEVEPEERPRRSTRSRREKPTSSSK